MTKPEGIPQDVWDAAKEAIEPWLGPEHQYRLDCQEEIAQAILKAKEQEREACIELAESKRVAWASAEYFGGFNDGCNTVSQAIRNRKDVG